MKSLVLMVLAGALALGVAPARAAGMDELPPAVQDGYKNLDPQEPVGPSVYRNFAAKKGPPWTIGYASSYAGNSWRGAVMDRLMKQLLPKYQAAGLVKDVIVTQSGLKDSLQAQQIRQLVDQGADAVLICCSNVTGMNDSIAYAHEKGVPVISFTGYVTSADAINTSVNMTDGGYQMAHWLAQEIGGKGNVLLVSGIPGTTASDTFDSGAQRALAEFPDIKLVGRIAGKWTDSIAQVEVKKFLAAHPEAIDGVVVQPAAETGVLKAVLASGRKLMPMTLGGEASAACYWRAHPGWVSTAFHFWPPGNEIETAFVTMVRTLEGQGPKVQSVTRQLTRYDVAAVATMLPDNCDLESTAWLEPPMDAWFPMSVADAYFLHPHDPLTWKPGS